MAYGTVNADVIGTSVAGSNLGAGNASIMKNRIINGSMLIWQRGTSFSSPSFGTYTVDRFYNPSGATTSISQSTNVPSGFRYSVSVSGNSGGSNGIAQRIESYNCTDLAGQSVTISFWALNSSGADNLQVALYYANSQDTFSGITQIGSTVVVSGSPSSSWTQYSATFTSLPSGAANGLALLIYRGGSASSTTLFTGVQLEVGSSATGFEYRQYGQELALCQRYLPAFASSGATQSQVAMGQCISTTQAACIVPFPVSVRTSPTGITASGTFNITQSNGGSSSASLAFSQSSLLCSQIIVTATGLTAGNATILNATGGGSGLLLFTGCEL